MMAEFLIQSMSSEIDSYKPPPGETSRTMLRVIADLERHRTTANAAAVDVIISNAKKEMYHDYLGCAFPIRQLVIDLKNAGLPAELIENAMNGKYDATLPDRYD